jgi:hypothetical protein
MKLNETEWIKKNDKLSEEMENFAKNFKCSKCNEFYCEHMLHSRARKFKDKIDKELDNLTKISFS